MSDRAYENLANTLSGQASRSRKPSDDKVVALNVNPHSPARETPPSEPAPQQRDWSASIQLVHEAHEAMRISGERVEELEAHLNDVIARAKDEVAQLTRRAESAEMRLVAAEREAREAEVRADELERWLAHLHDVILDSFGPLVRGQAQPKAMGGLPKASSLLPPLEFGSASRSDFSSSR